MCAALPKRTASALLALQPLWLPGERLAWCTWVWPGTLWQSQGPCCHPQAFLRPGEPLWLLCGMQPLSLLDHTCAALLYRRQQDHRAQSSVSLQTLCTDSEPAEPTDKLRTHRQMPGACGLAEAAG